MKERGELPNEEGDAVREFKAMHEENFWSNWPREMKEAKKKERQKPRRMKKKKGEKFWRSTRTCLIVSLILVRLCV